MPLDVVAVPRSHGVVLAAVVGDDDGGAQLQLVAEDGARFRFPAARALVRVSAEAPDGPDEARRLAALRSSLEPFADWLALHVQAGEGARLGVEDAARLAGLDGAQGALALALGIPRAEPWFERDGVELVARPMRDALQRLFHLNDAVFREAGDAALREWWPARARGVPDGWVDPAGDVGLRARIALERARWFELEYVPDPVVAGGSALAALTGWALSGDPQADARGKDLARALGLPEDEDQVLEQLVACGALAADVDPAPHRAQLAGPFGDDALEEARRIAAQPRAEGREDLTHEFTVAVDDAETREVDDALSLRRVGDEVELLVHIADVAALVPPGTALDDAVRARASSLFLPDRSVLMFPPELVVGRLSLDEGDAREALTGIFRIGPDGALHASRFVRSVVRLTRRVTYEDTRDPTALAADADTGRLLLRVCEELRGARERRGARILRLPSQKVSVRDGVPEIGIRLQDAPGDVVVTEAMVLVNSQAGALLAAAGAAALYRGQSGDVPAGREIPDATDPLYDLRVRRTFVPTQTSVDPLEHAGLGASAYVQCTSPLRRYTDLVNQRQLAAAAAGAPLPYSRDDIEALAPFLHDRERAVRHAADARTQYWVVRALADAGRTTLHGILSRAPRRGLGGVWVPELCRELPLRAPQGWRAPSEGTAADWRIAALRPHRGRIELAPPGE